MTNLSPAAQAVFDATWRELDYVPDRHVRWAAAAALRAAADQVVPEEPLHGGNQRWIYERDTREESRKKFLAIAAELEANEL